MALSLWKKSFLFSWDDHRWGEWSWNRRPTLYICDLLGYIPHTQLRRWMTIGCTDLWLGNLVPRVRATNASVAALEGKALCLLEVRQYLQLWREGSLDTHSSEEKGTPTCWEIRLYLKQGSVGDVAILLLSEGAFLAEFCSAPLRKFSSRGFCCFSDLLH